MALGQAMVLNIGSIDLSNASISLFGAILLALSLPTLGVTILFAVLVATTIFEAINGAVVAYAQVPSFALTLGTLGILDAATFVASGSETNYLNEHRELVTMLCQTRFAAIPLTFWMGVGVALTYWAILRFTRVGQGVTAMGKNEPGAIFSAVRTRSLNCWPSRSGVSRAVSRAPASSRRPARPLPAASAGTCCCPGSPPLSWAARRCRAG